MLRIRRAKTDEDIEKVYDVRWRGYKKYFPCRSACIDERDRAPNSVLLLAETTCCGTPVGTLRILDGASGPVELERFIHVSSVLAPDECPCAEATRFSVPFNPLAKQIKYFLWKAFFLYCGQHHIPTMLISVRPPAAKDYEFLMFQDVGSDGEYTHPELGNKPHRTYKMSVRRARELFEEHRHPLLNFMFCEHHGCISIE